MRRRETPWFNVEQGSYFSGVRGIHNVVIKKPVAWQSYNPYLHLLWLIRVTDLAVHQPSWGPEVLLASAFFSSRWISGVFSITAALKSVFTRTSMSAHMHFKGHHNRTFPYDSSLPGTKGCQWQEVWSPPRNSLTFKVGTNISKASYTHVHIS